MNRLFRAGLVLAGSLCGCSGNYQNLSTLGPPGPPEEKVWQAPRNGDYLCLVVPEGIPVYAHPYGVTPLLGYTRTLVAFSGWQEGRWISVQHYDGLMGWIDGTVVKPYQTVYPGHQCVVGRNAQRQPVFYIDEKSQ
jgi:hypothetical protein